MRKLKELYVSSFLELKNTRNLVLMAMFLAIAVVLGMTLTFFIVPTFKLSFVYLPNNFAFYLFGPAAGAIIGGVSDVLNFILNPKATFNLGITLCAVLSGILYGTIFYKKPFTLTRVIVANIINLFTITILRTYFLTFIYGDGFLELLKIRMPLSAAFLPVETALLYALVKGVEATGVIRQLKRTEREV